MPTMPFGKFKGHELEDVPNDYLRWLVGTVDLAGWLLAAVRRELDARDAEPPQGYHHEQTRRPEPPLRAELRDVVARWHRQLAPQFHPDRGGTNDGMRAVNVGRDELLEMLDEEGLLN